MIIADDARHVFSADTVRAICGYMNEQQPDSCLYIVQHATGEPGIISAELTMFDGMGATFDVRDGSAERRVRVAWDHPIRARGEVRAQLTMLLERAIGM